ncbi:MAG: hypothetical protein RLZZ621_1666, partial [Gemmatimonadota bacterium]
PLRDGARYPGRVFRGDGRKFARDLIAGVGLGEWCQPAQVPALPEADHRLHEPRIRREQARTVDRLIGLQIALRAKRRRGDCPTGDQREEGNPLLRDMPLRD